MMTVLAHSHPTHLGSHTHPSNRLLSSGVHLSFIHPSLGPLLTLFPTFPNPGLQRTAAHPSLVWNSLWPVPWVFLGRGSPFWTAASGLYTKEVRGVD